MVTDISKKPVRSLAWVVLLFVVAHTMYHIVSAMLTPLTPFIRDEFTLDYTQVGVLASAYNLAYGVSQLPAGWLADRLGPRVVLTIGVAGVALAGLFIGISPTYLVLVILLILMGIAGGGYHPSASPLVSAGVETKDRGKALGIHQIGGSISFFVAPLIAAGLAAALGWRGSFLAVSIPTLIFGVVFFVILGRLGYVKKPKAKSAAGEVIAPRPGQTCRLVSVLILGISSMVLLYSTQSFIPLYLVDHFNISKGAAAAMLALCVSGGLWAGPLGGYLSDRIGKLPVIVAAGIIGGPAVYLMNVVPFGWTFSAVLILIGMGQYLSMPVVEAYILSNVSESKRSTVLGFYYLGSRGGPGLITPAIGYMIDHFKFAMSFNIVAALIVGVTVVSAGICLWKREPKLENR